MNQPIYIAAHHQSMFGNLMEMGVPEIVRSSVEGACGEIGVEPGVLDVGSICAAYWKDGRAAVDGDACAINISGGLIAKGHPIGATGVAMIGWCAWQLLGTAPAELQVNDATAAATFNIGGPLCASVCSVLKTAS